MKNISYIFFLLALGMSCDRDEKTRSDEALLIGNGLVLVKE
jgi:hypothetical protein